MLGAEIPEVKMKPLCEELFVLCGLLHVLSLSHKFCIFSHLVTNPLGIDGGGGIAPELSTEGQGTPAPALKEFSGQFIPSALLVGLCCVCATGGGWGEQGVGQEGQ